MTDNLEDPDPKEEKPLLTPDYIIIVFFWTMMIVAVAFVFGISLLLYYWLN